MTFTVFVRNDLSKVCCDWMNDQRCMKELSQLVVGWELVNVDMH